VHNQVVKANAGERGYRLRLLAAFLTALPLAAVIVDRVAIAAGNQVITDSEIYQRLRLSAFENDKPPDFSAATRKAAADRLIDQKLVEHEMVVGHYPRPSEERQAALLPEYAKENYKSDMAALNRALAAYGLTPADLEEDLAREIDLLTFLNVRFRPAVQVTDADIRQYAREKSLNLDEFRNQIERTITDERADEEMDAWLKDQRRRTKIEYLEKDLAP
jgi:hypothetical protein